MGRLQERLGFYLRFDAAPQRLKMIKRRPKGTISAMARPHKMPPCLIAVLAALALLVQTFVGGQWIAAHASAFDLDAFGNVICTSQTGAPPKGSGHDGHDCDCCLFGCDLANGIVPESIEIAALSLQFAVSSDVKRESVISVRRDELKPQSPRAPPV